MNPADTHTQSRWTYPFMTAQYPTFPYLWQPEAMGVLFIVKVPPDLESLQEPTYLALMQTRLDQLIQDWAVATSQLETQQLLATHLSQLDAAQAIPLLEPDADPEFALSQWRQQWSETLILNNWQFRDRMRHYSLTFPTVPMAPDHPSYPDALDLHDDTTLEDWLSHLTL